MIGALYAAGVPLSTLEEFVLNTNLKRLSGKRNFPYLLSWMSWLKYPYAAFNGDAMVETFDRILEGPKTLGDMKIHFSALAIDLYRSAFVVYSNITHKDQSVSETIRIATTIPGLWAPYDPDDEARVIIDGGVASLSPVWLAPDFGEGEPVLVLQTDSSNERGFKSNIMRFVLEMIDSTSRSWDRYQIESNPRVQELNINCMGIKAMSFHLSKTQKLALIDEGRDTLLDALPDLKVLWDNARCIPAVTVNQAWSSNPAVTAEATARLMQRQFLIPKTGNRHLLYISYASEDEAQFKMVMKHIEPLSNRINVQVWSDLNIKPSDDITEELKNALEQTRLALLLTSANYFNDPSVMKQELPYFQQAVNDNTGGIGVLWLPLSSCDVSLVEQTEFVCAIQPATPLDMLPPGDQQLMLTRLSQRLYTFLEGS
jgi:predicted acylesterase/phospholipase RssA